MTAVPSEHGPKSSGVGPALRCSRVWGLSLGRVESDFHKSPQCDQVHALTLPIHFTPLTSPGPWLSPPQLEPLWWASGIYNGVVRALNVRRVGQRLFNS